MQRITISLPEEDAATLVREARRSSLSVSALVRRAIGLLLGHAETDAGKLPFANIGSSGSRHTARDAEKVLAREWGRRARRR